MTGQPNQLATASRPGNRHELERLLQTGPFASAPIQARGLGLERIRDRLRAHGVSVSLATLSYWQSGRSRPERRHSVVALEHLEHVLELRPGALTALLGPPRPRGRWLGKAPDRGDIAALVRAAADRRRHPWDGHPDGMSVSLGSASTTS